MEKYTTYIGRERRKLSLSFEAYNTWINSIKKDNQLMREIDKLKKGETTFEDLNEGPAGIFQGVKCPKGIFDRLASHLESGTVDEKSTLTTMLFDEVIKDIE